MIRVHPRGGRLEVRVYAGKDPTTGKYRTIAKIVPGTGRDAWRAAKRLEIELTDEVRRRRVGPTRATLNELLDQWLATAGLERSTLQRARSRLDRHVRPTLGTIELATLRNEHLDVLYARLGERIAASSVRRIHGDLHAALAQAVRWGWIPTNPAAHTRRIVVRAPEPAAPTPAAIAALLQAVAARNPDLLAWLYVDAATGMRRGEVCALRRSDLALDHRVIRKTHAIGEAKGGWYEKPVKNRIPHPIAIDDGTAAVLRAQLERVDKRAADLGVNLVPDPYVFTWEPDGSRPWTPNHVTKAVARIRTRVPGAEAITPNALRHFVATALLADGHSPKEVAARLGHARPSTSVDVYAALMPAADRAAAETMGELLARLAGDAGGITVAGELSAGSAAGAAG